MAPLTDLDDSASDSADIANGGRLFGYGKRRQIFAESALRREHGYFTHLASPRRIMIERVVMHCLFRSGVIPGVALGITCQARQAELDRSVDGRLGDAAWYPARPKRLQRADRAHVAGRRSYSPLQPGQPLTKHA